MRTTAEEFISGRQGENAAKRSGTMRAMLTTLPAIRLNHDRAYEDGYSSGLRPHGIPRPVSFVVKEGGNILEWGIGEVCCVYVGAEDEGFAIRGP
jgi:hypothetical protein